MSNVHKSVFAEYARSKVVEIDFSEENPEKKYDFGDEIGRLAFKLTVHHLSIYSVYIKWYKRTPKCLRYLPQKPPNCKISSSNLAA
jgi:hypothetical protein